MHGFKPKKLDNSDRAFVESIYEEYKKLMYAVAWSYFKGNSADVDDAFARTLERMCRYVEKFHAVECNKMKAYVISVTENVCRQMLLERKHKSGQDAFEEYDENMPDPVDPYSAVFEQAGVSELLDSLEGLNERDKLLLYLRHVEQLEYAEIAEQMDMTEGAVRTALTRAKQRIQ